MAAVSLTTLLSRARSRADQVTSTFCTDTEVTYWLNEGAQKLHELLAQAYEEDYFEKTSTSSTAAGTETYALPSDLMKLLHLELLVGGTYVTLRRYMRSEQNAYRASSSYAPGSLPRYRMAGSNVRLLPAPAGVYTLRFVYVPLLQVLQGGSGSTYINLLTGGTDTVDFVNGWERFVVAYAAKQMMDKEESDSSALLGELQKMEAELKQLAEHRDANMPAQVVDMERTDDALLWD